MVGIILFAAMLFTLWNGNGNIPLTLTLTFDLILKEGKYGKTPLFSSFDLDL